MAENNNSTALLQHGFNQGVKLLHAGRWSEAETIYRGMSARWPRVPELHHNLGLALEGQGKFQQAVAAFHAALALRPGFAEAHNNLGNTLRDMQDPAQAIEAYRRAVALNDKSAICWNNLGVVLKDTGQFAEAEACFRRAMANPTGYPVAHGNLLCTLHFNPQWDAAAIYQEAQRWNQQFAQPLQGEILPHDNDPTPDRRLRIGYVSGDFRRHCQALFTPTLLAHHDHQQYEIFCYSNVAAPDAVTARLQRHADVWRDISRLSDAQAAQLIRQDKIDILVDLTLHMTGNRLLVFARKPAPVQVTWLGYPGTTGLEAMDYRLTDPRLDPLDSRESEIRSTESEIRNPKPEIRTKDQNPNVPISNDIRGLPGPLSHCEIGSLGIGSDLRQSRRAFRDFGLRISDFITQEPYYSERSIRLPTFWCYDPRGMEENPDIQLPDPGPMPALAAGHITFGCLNNFCKINDSLLELWAQVMAAVPHSHLLLLAPPGPHRERVVRKLGVTLERVQFVPLQHRQQYLETYRKIDLCLDTLPYNGHTTSLDALWMGVPVVTLVGRTIAGRAGWSQLHNLDLMELVGQTDEQFIKLAVELAGDLDRLSVLRSTLRQRMEQSPLMDGPGFARHIQDAFRLMWRTWCETHS